MEERLILPEYTEEYLLEKAFNPDLFVPLNAPKTDVLYDLPNNVMSLIGSKYVHLNHPFKGYIVLVYGDDLPKIEWELRGTYDSKFIFFDKLKNINNVATILINHSSIQKHSDILNDRLKTRKFKAPNATFFFPVSHLRCVIIKRSNGYDEEKAEYDYGRSSLNDSTNQAAGRNLRSLLYNGNGDGIEKCQFTNNPLLVIRGGVESNQGEYDHLRTLKYQSIDKENNMEPSDIFNLTRDTLITRVELVFEHFTWQPLLGTEHKSLKDSLPGNRGLIEVLNYGCKMNWYLINDCNFNIGMKNIENFMGIRNFNKLLDYTNNKIPNFNRSNLIKYLESV